MTEFTFNFQTTAQRRIRNMRIAYQIWCLIQSTGGSCTARDMAELTGESIARCAHIAQNRGWEFRRLSPDTFAGSPAPLNGDYA